MTATSLAQSYLLKALVRLEVLELYLSKGAFYGDADFLPTEEYTREQAARALSDARFCAEMAREVIPLPR